MTWKAATDESTATQLDQASNSTSWYPFYTVRLVYVVHLQMRLWCLSQSSKDISSRHTI
ncbi:hypothetical protein LSH36_64g01002 [Paralvinella palmiformis]|uniref:Uncharacterized protein n=1 Tax=Paralvinella palmiformis TaxID=53620 RepID=A0AAD9K3W3_9ANNE|nr:hypothetical protein LSH36_64g01002 [Paralvinella palmiformis]